MYAFNLAAIFLPGHPYIESTTVLSDSKVPDESKIDRIYPVPMSKNFYTKSGISSLYIRTEVCLANNWRSVSASSTPTSKGTFDRCVEALSVGIRSVAAKVKALGLYNEGSRYLGYLLG